MAEVTRRRGGPRVQLVNEEIWLLTKLLDGLDELLVADAEDVDPLAGTAGTATSELADPGDLADLADMADLADVEGVADPGDDLESPDADGADGAADPADPDRSRAGASDVLGRGDVFAGIAGLDWPDADPVSPPRDAALRRLLPDAYRDDPEAAAEFRRYTDAALREALLTDIGMVRASLATISPRGHLVLDVDHTESWLRVLTDARLVLAVRLGIETASDQGHLDEMAHDDPRTTPYEVYCWLGYLLERLLDVLG